MSISSCEIDSKKNRTSSTQQIEGPFFISKSKFEFDSSLSNWSTLEKIKFAVYLYLYKDQYDLVKMSKKFKWEFFQGLSRFVKSRNLCQCKSFHTKISKKYQSIGTLIQELKHQDEDFQSHFEYYLKKLEELKQNPMSNLLASPEKIKLQNCQTALSYTIQPNPNLSFNSLVQKFYPNKARRRIQKQIKLQQCHILFSLWINKLNQIFAENEIQCQAVN